MVAVGPTKQARQGFFSGINAFRISMGMGKMIVELLSEEISKGGQVPELQGHGIFGKYLRRLAQSRRCLVLAFGTYDLCATLTLRFGLTGDSPLHLLGKIDVLYFDVRDLDAPGLRVPVEYLLEMQIDLLPVGEGAPPAQKK